MTAALALVHSFEATFYLLYNASQTVQATWVTYDRARTDPTHLAFCKAMQLKTAAYMPYAVASRVLKCATYPEQLRNWALRYKLKANM